MATDRSDLVRFYQYSGEQNIMRKINLRENRAYLETYTPGILYDYDILQIYARGFFMRRPQTKSTYIQKNSLLYDDHATPDF
jgi:hypothetical protein